MAIAKEDDDGFNGGVGGDGFVSRGQDWRIDSVITIVVMMMVDMVDEYYHLSKTETVHR